MNIKMNNKRHIIISLAPKIICVDQICKNISKYQMLTPKWTIGLNESPYNNNNKSKIGRKMGHYNSSPYEELIINK
jgi:hypothetical protein